MDSVYQIRKKAGLCVRCGHEKEAHRERISTCAQCSFKESKRRQKLAARVRKKRQKARLEALRARFGDAGIPAQMDDS